MYGKSLFADIRKTNGRICRRGSQEGPELSAASCQGISLVIQVWIGREADFSRTSIPSGYACTAACAKSALHASAAESGKRTEEVDEAPDLVGSFSVGKSGHSCKANTSFDNRKELAMRSE
jgi:hypothetical protein